MSQQQHKGSEVNRLLLLLLLLPLYSTVKVEGYKTAKNRLSALKSKQIDAEECVQGMK